MLPRSAAGYLYVYKQTFFPLSDSTEFADSGVNITTKGKRHLDWFFCFTEAYISENVNYCVINKPAE